MTRTSPTANFASLVYGPAGVPADDPAESFHEASRLYPSLAPLRLEVLAGLADGGELRETSARSSRVHEHRPTIELPAGIRLRGTLDAAIRRRRSSLAATASPLRLHDLAALLISSYAALSEGERPPNGEARRRPVPSAGALYPLEIYAAAVGVNDLERGIYHFNPFRRCLSLLGPLGWRELREAVVDPSVLDHAAAVLIVTAMFWRSRFKYGQRGYRFALLEAGHVVQNVVLAAAELDLHVLPLGGFYDRRLDALVGADGLDEATVYAVVVGGTR